MINYLIMSIKIPLDNIVKHNEYYDARFSHYFSLSFPHFFVQAHSPSVFDRLPAPPPPPSGRHGFEFLFPHATLEIDVLHASEDDQEQIEAQVAEAARQPEKGDVDVSIVGESGEGESHVGDAHAVVASRSDDLVPNAWFRLEACHVA